MLNEVMDIQNTNSENYEDYSSDVKEFNKKLTNFIEEVNCEDLDHFLSRADTINSFEKYPYEILEAVVPYLRLDESSKQYEKRSCCEDILNFMAVKCNASELLLFMVEHLERLKSEDVYFLLLKPLRICLPRCKNSSLMIDICFENIHEKLISMTLPNVEKDDDALKSLISSYTYISNFVENLYDDLLLQLENESPLMQMKTKYLVIDFLISLFGKPFCYSNLSSDKLETVIVSGNIIDNICANIFALQFDVIYYFRFIKYGNLHKYHLSSGPTISFMNFHNPSHDKLFSLTKDLSLCNFYWIIFCKIHDVKIPQVYNRYYIAYNCINASNFFLSDNEGRNIMLMKALELLSFALKILESDLIPFKALDLPIHNELLRNLANCIIYGPLKYQKLSLDNFINYIHKFDLDAKYVVIKNIIYLNYHTKITGVVIGVLKDIVSKISLNEDDSNKEKIFLEDHLKVLVLQICVLQDGINTDLIEISDQIISTLNFILFLLIRKGTKNLILNIIKNNDDNNFLSTMKTALEKQKVQWRATINDVHKKTDKCEDETLKFSVNGIPEPSKEEQIRLSEKAMNTLLVMENILCRIEELVK